VTLAWSSTTVNYQGAALITRKGWQFIGFYDADRYMVLGKRRINETTWEFEKTEYRGNTYDSHNAIYMMLDGDDILHVAFDHHANPLHYVKADEPLSIKVGKEIPMIGKNEKRVSYPNFFLLPNGNMLCVYRDGSSGNGRYVFNHYNTKKKEWTRLHNGFLSGENRRGVYYSLYVDHLGTFHCVWCWRDTGDFTTNHDLAYARSTDEGVTWKTFDGRKYDLPITMETSDYIWYIPTNHSYHNWFSLATDNGGNIYIAAFWDSGTGIPQERLLWHENGQWRMKQISNRITPDAFYGYGSGRHPASVPSMLSHIEGDKQVFYLISVDIEYGEMKVLHVSDDLTKDTWERYDLTDHPGTGIIDYALWRESHRLQMFVQRTKQGDHDIRTPYEPQMIYVMEVNGI
jgi:hypothetical protein